MCRTSLTFNELQNISFWQVSHDTQVIRVVKEGVKFSFSKSFIHFVAHFYCPVSDIQKILMLVDFNNIFKKKKLFKDYEDKINLKH